MTDYEYISQPSLFYERLIKPMLNDTTTNENQSETDEHKWDITADKQLRKDLDQSLQNLKELKPSRERALAKTKLQEAIMWLGMDLKRLHEPNPYPNSYNPENTIVDPTADGLTL